MLLMLVIFGKFGSFLVVEAFRVGEGGGVGDEALLILYIYAINFCCGLQNSFSGVGLEVPLFYNAIYAMSMHGAFR